MGTKLKAVVQHVPLKNVTTAPDPWCQSVMLMTVQFSTTAITTSKSHVHLPAHQDFCTTMSLKYVTGQVKYKDVEPNPDPWEVTTKEKDQHVPQKNDITAPDKPSHNVTPMTAQFSTTVMLTSKIHAHLPAHQDFSRTIFSRSVTGQPAYNVKDYVYLFLQMFL